jgi:hypothetical protein
MAFCGRFQDRRPRRPVRRREPLRRNRPLGGSAWLRAFHHGKRDCGERDCAAAAVPPSSPAEVGRCRSSGGTRSRRRRRRCDSRHGRPSRRFASDFRAFWPRDRRVTSPADRPGAEDTKAVRAEGSPAPCTRRIRNKVAARRSRSLHKRKFGDCPDERDVRRRRGANVLRSHAPAAQRPRAAPGSDRWKRPAATESPVACAAHSPPPQYSPFLW